jgi:hypothetical protein
LPRSTLSTPAASSITRTADKVCAVMVATIIRISQDAAASGRGMQHVGRSESIQLLINRPATVAAALAA